MPKKSDFFQDVYAVVRLIPKGRVTTYGAIGIYLGAAKSARMVGWAMNNAHGLQPPIPAHRVVNRNGLLTGKAYFKPPSLMQHLLEKDGITVENNTIINFKEHFWEPLAELKL
jgi:methylated-DNA-protein-cysteine methyltransferase-like protein